MGNSKSRILLDNIESPKCIRNYDDKKEIKPFSKKQSKHYFYIHDDKYMINEPITSPCKWRYEVIFKLKVFRKSKPDEY